MITYDTKQLSTLSRDEQLKVADLVKKLLDDLRKKYEPSIPVQTSQEIVDDEFVPDTTKVAHRAFLKDKLIGMALVGDSRLDSGRYLSDVYVDPKYRGLGIGEKLVNRAIQDSQSSGYKSLNLGVFAQNIVARRLYEKLGFNTVSLKMQKNL